MGTHLSLAPKTPDKMRVLMGFTLLVVGTLAGGKEKREMEMWMKMKAMEGCFGEDLVKDHMIKMKRSAAKCMRVEAPELELPMFENSFRFANAMGRAPRVGGKMRKGAGFKNKIEDPWLRSHLEKYCDQCIEFAENIPQSML